MTNKEKVWDIVKALRAEHPYISLTYSDDTVLSWEYDRLMGIRDNIPQENWAKQEREHIESRLPILVEYFKANGRYPVGMMS